MIAPMTVKAFALAGFVSAASAMQPQSSAQETLNTLDKDGSGAVELPEILAFAESEGMSDANAVATEFQSLDRDGNGKLDASELEGMLSLAEDSAASTEINSPSMDAPAQLSSSLDPPVSLEVPNLDMPNLDIPSLESITAKLNTPATNAAPQPVSNMANQAEVPSFARYPLAGQAAQQSQNLRASQAPVQLLQQQEEPQQQQQQQAAPSSTAQETLNVLDKDGSGWVELEEIQVFAKSQGLSDANSVLAEFQSLDRDGNGKLDASELQGMLSTSEESAAPSESAAASAERPEAPHQLPMEAPVLKPMSATVPMPSTLAAAAPRISAPIANPAQLPSFVGSRAQAASLPVETVPMSAPPRAQSPQQQRSFQPAQQQQPPVPAPIPSTSTSVQLPPAHVSDNATSWLQQSAGKAEKMAIRAAAEVFARQAQQVLAMRGQEEQQADQLEALAKQLRRQEEDIVGSAATATHEAALKAVNGVLKQSVDKIKNMETALHKTEEQAAQKHKQAEDAMSLALKAQSDLTATMRRIRGSARGPSAV